jgi:murein DD-endopeptidase MepM/ murein hydrolase activator NlpD
MTIETNPGGRWKVRLRSEGRRRTRHRRFATFPWWVPVALAIATSSTVLVPTVSADCWREPVSGVVIDPFRPPDCPWCAGNRGLEYHTNPGSVRAVAAGLVSFSGTVVGTRFVVVRLANGWQITYGRLAGAAVERGDRVISGSVIGSVRSAFYFGVRVDGRYVDPARYIGRFVGRPRLIPLDGSAARPAPAPRLRCQE